MLSLSINHDEICKITDSVQQMKKVKSPFPQFFKKYSSWQKQLAQFSKKSENPNIITKEKTHVNKSLAQQSSKTETAKGVHRSNSCLKDVDMVLSVTVNIFC